MAKNGFSMSNRVAVESVSASKTLTVDDCGKLVVVTSTGSSGVIVTLPSVAAAQAGWNCEVAVVSGAVAQDVTVSQGSDSATLYTVAVNATSGSGDDEVSFAGLSAVTFPSGTLATGDRMKVVGDGSRWYAEVFSNVVISGTV